MRRTPSLVLILSLVLTPLVRGASEPATAASRIERVSLFKNGLCVVHRVVELPRAGVYELAETPDPVHGTFFVTSAGQVRSRLVERTVRVPAEEAGAVSLHEDLAGQEVTVVLRAAPGEPVRGTVASTSGGNERGWNRQYERERAYWWSPSQPDRALGEPGPGRFLVLKTEEGRYAYVDPSQIVMLQTHGARGEVERKRPTLELSVDSEDGEGDGAVTVQISYLAKGLAWAPAYRVDLTDGDELALAQSAVIRNELEDLEDVEVELVSGFPSMVFSHVLSPMSPDATWAAFFSQLGKEFQQGHPATSNVLRQAAEPSNQMGQPGGVAAAGLAGERADLHYESIGRITLGEGEALHLETASGRASYERVVEWTIPDSRDEFGRRLEEYRRAAASEDDPWDAVRFRNPLDMPMTTAPATIAAGGRFLGQQMSTWVNPGERTSLRITKALSITTRHTEQESVDEERGYLYIGGHRYRRVAVDGRLVVHNRRDRPVAMVVKRRFSGELRQAEGEPQVALLESGVYSDNQHHELTWELTLDPKEERTLTYAYQVYVRH